jgi:hypothetical protein
MLALDWLGLFLAEALDFNTVALNLASASYFGSTSESAQFRCTVGSLRWVTYWSAAVTWRSFQSSCLSSRQYTSVVFPDP